MELYQFHYLLLFRQIHKLFVTPYPYTPRLHSFYYQHPSVFIHIIRLQFAFSIQFRDFISIPMSNFVHAYQPNKHDQNLMKQWTMF